MSNPTKSVREFNMLDKLGYTLGDLGCCCTEQFRAMYLSVFYILILKVDPVHVGILMLITKIWDAINDPIIGALMDSRKASKNGKFIPWIRAFSFPMAVICVLGFVNVSNLAYGLRLICMFVTYVLYEAIYTCVKAMQGEEEITSACDMVVMAVGSKKNVLDVEGVTVPIYYAGDRTASIFETVRSGYLVANEI